MAVSFIARARTRIAARVDEVVVSGLGTVLLGAGVVGVLPAKLAAAAGGGLVALWAAAHLIRSALSLHAQGAPGVCRGAGFVGVAVVATAVTAVLPLLSPPGLIPALATAGLVAAALFYVLGTLMLPGAATSVRVRLRRGFDGLGLGISLGFAAWLLPPFNRVPGVAVVAILCATAAIATMTVAALRSTAYRPVNLACGGGAVAALTGTALAAVMLAYGHTGRGLPAAGLLIVVGLAATRWAVARVPAMPRADGREDEPHLSGYPLLAVPAAVGLLAALYHLIVVGSFDRTAILLGLAMVLVLTLREFLAVSDIRRYAHRLKSQEAHFRSLVTGATDLTLVLDESCTVRWQSPTAARLFGLADAEVVGRHFADLVHPDDVGDVRAVLEATLAGEQPAGPPVLVHARVRDGHGMWRETESAVSDQRSVPEVAALVVHVRDVGERRHLERTLHQLSYTDQLTGLANRRALMRDLQARRQRPGRPGTLLVVDLHGLAEINDARGRETGDAVLIEVGRRIGCLLGDDDLAVRLGGDEFAVLTGDGPVLAYALATRLVTALVQPYQLPGTTVQLHASVGLAELGVGDDAQQALRQADLARSRARQLGRDRVEWYDTDTEILLNRRMDLEREIGGAAQRGELDLVFQPVLSFRDNQPVGAEALLRWRHPQLGTILPAELLPVAEAVGATSEIGDWVLSTACRHLEMWSDGGTTVWMAVNVSPRELLAAGFPGRVAAALAAHGLPPDRLVIEVAESWITEDVPAVVAALAALRQLGVRAALDDFGAGQGSLSHLRRLPVDMLKLDPTLVTAPEAESSGAPAVIDVVVSLGRRLGLEIVAKGLETAEQIARARRAGCMYGQGSALAAAAPAERTEAYFDSHRTTAG